jgi:hypothetical protein
MEVPMSEAMAIVVGSFVLAMAPVFVIVHYYRVMVAVRTRTLHGGVDQKRETTPVLQNCSVLAVDGIDGRYRVRRKEPEGRVQTHQARRVSGGGDAGVWMR